MLDRPDGFMLYGKLGVAFFSTSELLYPNMKIILRLIRARPNFYLFSHHPNVSLRIVECNFYNRRNALKDDYHKKRMDMLDYPPVENNSLETLAKTFIIPAKQNQFIQENIFNNARIRRVAIAMNTNSAFFGCFTKNTKKRVDMLLYTLVEFNCLEIPEKNFIIPARQNQLIQENVFNNATVRRIAIAMNTKTALIGSDTLNQFWYQQFALRQIRILRGDQPTVDFDVHN